MEKKQLLEQLANAIVEGDGKKAVDTARAILEAGIDPLEAIQQGATKGLDEIGRRFQNCEAFLPELILSGDAMKACTDVIKPHIRSEQKDQMISGKVVIGSAFGDIHDIGKNIVATILGGSGFDIYDMGINVAVKQFVAKAEEVQANVIAMSSLLTSTSHYQRLLIEHLKDAGLRQKYYVVIGGAPVTPEWAVKIGADGYARTAAGATELLKKIIQGPPPPLTKTLVVNN
jgi:corrinoid protein of di/trimethylamine methyltransferase